MRLAIKTESPVEGYAEFAEWSAREVRATHRLGLFCENGFVVEFLDNESRAEALVTLKYNLMDERELGCGHDQRDGSLRYV